MRVYTFIATDPQCPAQAIARLWGPEVDHAGKKSGWHPIIIYGATPAEAEAKALAWWDAETSKTDKRKAPRQKPQPAVEDVGDVV